MKTILLPTDFSENAQNAIHYAISLFGLTDVHYVLLHAYGIEARHAQMLRSMDGMLEEEADRYMEGQARLITGEFKGISMESITAKGPVTDIIYRIALEKKVSLIVMGTLGASGLEEVLIGSNSYDVIRMTRCPVLLVPEKATFREPERIVFAADYKKINHVIAFEPLYEIAGRFNSELLVLNVIRSGEEISSEAAAEEIKLNRYFINLNHDFYSGQNDDVAGEIGTFVNVHNADLVVMLAREKSFFHRVFHPSITKKITLHSQTPVLVLHDSD